MNALCHLALRRPGLRRRAPRGDRGVASLELLGMIPLALVFAILAVQVGAFMWAVTSTNDAVRQGARALTLGQDGCVAAEDVLSESLRRGSVCSQSGGMGSGSTVTLVVDIPIAAAVEDLVPDVSVTRTAYLP